MMKADPKIVKKIVFAILVTTCCQGYAAPAVVQFDPPTAGSTLHEARQQMEQNIIPGQQARDVISGVDSSDHKKDTTATDAGMSQEKVYVARFRIEGDKLLDRTESDGVLNPWRKKDLTFTELQQIANSLNQIYKKKGYMLANVFLPAQDARNGTVTFQVVAGRVGAVTVDNKTDIRKDAVDRQIRFLKSGDFVLRQNLERAVWLLNDLTGADAKVLLKPGSMEGTTDIHFIIDKSSGKHGTFFVDNYGNRYHGYNEVGVTYDVWNPGKVGDVINIAGFTSGHKMHYGYINYTVPAFRDGLTLTTGYSQLGYNLGREYEFLDAEGTARVFHFGADYAFERGQRQNVYGALRYEHSKLKDEYRAFDFDYADKHSDALIASLYGNRSDSSGDTSWRADLEWGTVSFDNNAIADDNHTEGTYAKLNGMVFRRQDINRRLSFNFLAKGQIASKNLDSSEKITIGGINGVRAYPNSEASGDCGYLTRAEFRYLIPVPRYDQTLQLAAYFDHGGVKANKSGHSFSDTGNFRRLQGAGIGLLWYRRDDWWVRTDYAWRIGKDEPLSDRSHLNGHWWLQAGVYF